MYIGSGGSWTRNSGVGWRFLPSYDNLFFFLVIHLVVQGNGSPALDVRPRVQKAVVQ